MINLQEFVSVSLTQIIAGISEAQTNAGESGAYINVPLKQWDRGAWKILG